MNSSIKFLTQILSQVRVQVGIAVVFGLAIFVYVMMGIRGVVEVPRQLDLGFFSLQLYSLAIIGAVLISVWVFNLLRQEDKELCKIDIWEGLLVVMIPAIIGARLYHVITDYYLYQNDFWAIFEIWNGGLGIIGGLIGGLIGAVWYLRKQNLPVRKAVGLLAVVAPLGQAIGRLGNFFNQELFGLPVEELPWAMYIPAEQNPLFFLRSYEYFHPLFLYEAVMSLSLFLLLFALWRRRINPSSLVIGYMVGYGLIRYLLDFLRVDGRAGIGYFTYAQILIMGMLVLMLGLGIGYQIWHYQKYGKWFTDKSELEGKQGG